MQEISYAVFFDMDGTLLQTEKLAVPAFQRTFKDLNKQGLYDGPTPTDEQFTHVLGMTLTQLWDTLMPGASDEAKEQANIWLLEHEKALLQEGATDLYPGVKEQLGLLKEQGVSLFVASNGMQDYIESICEQFGITELFTDLYSADRFQTKSKNDLVARLLAAYPIKQAVMVGDRHSDVEAGKANKLFTIGCDFGFAKPGELDGADVIIRSYAELLEQLPFSIDTKK